MNPFIVLLFAAIFYNNLWNVICGHPNTVYEWIGFIGTWYFVNFFHGIVIETLGWDKQ